MCLDKLKRLFRKFKTEEKPEEEIPLEEQRWFSLRNFKKVFRIIDTSRGGLNMPKRQPCHECGSWSRRIRKSVTGAFYRCRTHGEFFVRYPHPEGDNIRKNL